MKTKNNVQKAITKMLAVIFSLALVSLTVNAQDLWTLMAENESVKLNKSFLVNYTDSSLYKDLGSETKTGEMTEMVKPEAECTLELEGWMLTGNYFLLTAIAKNETEPGLKLEEWMTNENLFMGNPFQIQEEKDKSLVLESWMTDDNLWEVK